MIDVYTKLLERLTGSKIEIENENDGRWTIIDTENNLGHGRALHRAVMDYVDSFFIDVEAYINEPDEKLDKKAQELKQHYRDLLEIEDL
ncbi:MAG: hypothetical protein WCO84_09695 [bacterium]